MKMTALYDINHLSGKYSGTTKDYTANVCYSAGQNVHQIVPQLKGCRIRVRYLVATINHVCECMDLVLPFAMYDIL